MDIKESTMTEDEMIQDSHDLQYLCYLVLKWAGEHTDDPNTMLFPMVLYAQDHASANIYKRLWEETVKRS
jgi:hypothetical protein